MKEDKLRWFHMLIFVFFWKWLVLVLITSERMGCVLSTDIFSFPSHELVSCWGIQIFHIQFALCWWVVYTAKRLHARDSWSTWRKALIWVLPFTQGTCVPPHSTGIFLLNTKTSWHSDHDNTHSCERRERCWKPAHTSWSQRLVTCTCHVHTVGLTGYNYLGKVLDSKFKTSKNFSRNTVGHFISWLKKAKAETNC